ncbi:hypothetical protein MRB53_011629 [Persea americana]|uniref:Uncharacterized protein n=1 Tax=Persea americana TaxID=3435 RepID=A0ACC2LV51_PERAE|nr:hypothetical protein MRB53_011629 [Persea americana]
MVKTGRSLGTWWPTINGSLSSLPLKSKQDTEGIAYQWNYMVENQHGDDGMQPGICSNRKESSPLYDKSKSLVLVNYFEKIPYPEDSCMHHSGGLINMLHTCYGAAGDRWANFVAVDYYKRSEGVPFQAVNTLNGKLLCGCDDVHACVMGSCRYQILPLLLLGKWPFSNLLERIY